MCQHDRPLHQATVTPHTRTSPSAQRFPPLAWRVFAFALAGVIAYLFLLTLSPFFSALAWSAILAYGLYPVYRYLRRVTSWRPSLCAFLMCILLTLGVILPLFTLSVLIGDEVIRTYRHVSVLIQETQEPLGKQWEQYPLVSSARAVLEKYERLTGTSLWSVIAENLAQGSRYLIQRLSSMAGDLLVGLAQLGIVLLTTFFLFRDGEILVAWIQQTLPISIDRQAVVIRRLEEVVIGTIYGNCLIAVIEGVIGGVAFWAVGLSSPVLWGTVMGILAFLPLVGASFVWIPGVVYLLFQAAYVKMTVLLLVGIAIALIDYVVRTIVVGTKSKLHTLLVFLSVFGGLTVFGLVGIVVGPLVVAIGITLLETYRVESGEPSLDTLESTAIETSTSARHADQE